MRFYLAALAACLAFAGPGCISPMHVHDLEFAGRSARHQEVLAGALQEALYKLRPRAEKKKDPAQKVVVKVEKSDIKTILRGKKIFIEIAMLGRGLPDGSGSADADYIRHVFEQFILEHMEAFTVPRTEADVILKVVVRTFGVDVDSASFPLSYLPIFSSLSVQAVVRLSLYACTREGQAPLFKKDVSDKKSYQRYSLFGFVF